MTVRCIYCGHTQNKPFDKEHVVPLALGKFLLDGKELTITDRVCNTCNTELSKCETELCYCGPEAMFRKKVGIKGRLRKTPKENPFYPNRRSPKPIRMEGVRPGMPYPQLWELDSKADSIAELNQIIFCHPETGEWAHIPLTKTMSKQDLVKDIKGKVGRTDLEFFISWAPEDKDWINKLLGDDAKRLDPVDMSGFQKFQRINVQTTFTITANHHRAIAKIALNYMMYFRMCAIKGDEEAFAEIREFIRYGRGHPNRFVRLTNRQVLLEAGAGIGLKDYGHIITCDVGKAVMSQVHLFTGREHGHGTYEVSLGRYPFKIIDQDRGGHWFRITSTPEDRKDTGEIIALEAPLRIIPATTFREPKIQLIKSRNA